MYELDGYEYSLQEVEEAAAGLNLSIEEYTNKYNMTKSAKQPTTGQDATVAAGTASSTDSDLENTSLESPVENKFTSSQINEGVVGITNKVGNKSDLWRSTQSKSKNVRKKFEKERVKLNAMHFNKPEDFAEQEQILIDDEEKELNQLSLNLDISDTDDVLLTYNDAFVELEKDPSLVDGKGNRYGGFLKNLAKIVNYSYDPYEGDDRSIDIEDDVKAKLIDIASERQMQQLAKGRMSLADKEALLTEARLKVFNSKQLSLQDEVQSVTEEISLMSGGSMKMNDSDSPERIDQFNSLVDKKNNIGKSFQLLQGQYGIDVATGIINNNFKGTEELNNFNERYLNKEKKNEIASEYGENFGLTNDLMSRFNQGIFSAVVKMNPLTLGSVGVGALASEVTNLISDGNDYNVYDEFVDVVSGVADYNLAGKGKKEKFEFSGGAKGYAILAADMLPFSLAIIGAAKGGNIKGVKKIIGNTIGGKAGRLNGISSKLKNEILVADAAFRVTALDNLKEAKSLGLESGAASTYAFTKSLGTAITSAKIGIEGQLLGPQIIKKQALNSFAGTLKAAANKKGLKSASSNFLKMQTGELLQEETEVLLDLAVKTSFALALPGYEDSVQQQKELIAGTVMLSTGLGGLNTVSTFNQNKKEFYDSVIRQGSDLQQSFDVMIKNAKDPKAIEELKKGKQFAIDIIRASKLAPENVTAEQLELLVEKQKLLKKKETTDSAFHPELNEQIKEIDNKINQGGVVKGKEVVAEKIKAGVEAYADKLGVDSDYFTQKEVDEFVESLDEKQKKLIKKSGAQNTLGFFYDKKDGSTGFVINTDVATNEGVVTTGAHEILHAIVYETVKNNPNTAINLGKALTVELANIDFNNITETDFAKRLDSYLSDPNLKESDKWEEALNLFSEATLSGDITYDDNIFSKVKNTFNKILKLAGIQIEFNTGRDVYDFVKDYNNSILEGKVDKRIIKGAKEGFKGKLVTKPKNNIKEDNTVKLSKSTDIDALVGDVTKAEWDATEADKAINKAVPKLEGLIKSKIPVNPPPGFSKEDFVQGTIVELIPHMRNFNPEINDSFSGWINSQLSNKIGNVFKKNEAATKQEFETDVTEAKNVVQEESTIEAPKKTKSKLRRALKIDEKLINKVKVAVRKTLGTKLPPIESKKFKLALQKAFRTELKVPLADLLGTRAEYKNFLEDNFNAIYDAIPQETLNKRFKQFIEATGKREKTPQGNAVFNKRKINKQEFIDYFLGSDVGASTKGTRKDALAETLGEIMALDATLEVAQESETKTKREAVAELQGQKTTSTDIAKIGLTLDRDPSVKFAKVFIDKASKKAQEKAGVTNPKVLNPNNKNDRDYYAETLEKTWSQYLPVEIMKAAGFASVNKTDEAKVLARGQYFTGNAFDVVKTDYKTNEKPTFTDEQRRIVKAATSNKGFTQTKKGIISIRDFNSTEYQKYIKDNFDGAEYIFLQLQDMMQNNPETIPSVAAFFNTASSSSNHLIRQIAIPRGVDKDYLKNEKLKAKASDDFKNELISENKKKELFKKYKTEKEHIWQQNQAGEYIFNMMVNGNVKKPGYFKFIKDNYYMLGLTAYNNNKLKDSDGLYGEPYDLGVAMTQEFTDALNEAVSTGNFSEVLPSLHRYFNDKTNNNGGGFNSNELTFDGKSISEIYKVIVDSKIRDTETQAFQNELIKEQILGQDIDSQKEMNAFIGIAPAIEKAATSNNSKLPAEIKFSRSEEYTNKNVVNIMTEIDNTNQNEVIKFSKSQDLSKDFNDIIENKTGIGSDKVYAKVKAQVAGAGKGKFQFFVPPSAEDFVGLLYATLGKGKVGDAQMAWYRTNLLTPFSRAIDNLNRDRLTLMNDYKALKKDLKIIPKNLRKKLPGEPFTREQAVRVYIWNQQGLEVPGLSKTDLKELTSFVEKNPDLKVFADQLLNINKGDKYAGPKDFWTSGTISTDLIEGLNTTKRAKYLELWQQNVNEIFSIANLNKLEAAYGKPYRDALENILQRMKTGRNRTFASDGLTARVTDWLTNSVGAIMFFNTRSAILQTISSINFINFTDNNPLRAGAALLNAPQYGKDFMKLMNSPFLLARRDGLKINVNEADISEMAKDPSNMARRFVAQTLRLGFLPTQIADSFAIASGGATFYRNRIRSLTKQGMDPAAAEKQAMIDFIELAEESQQSSRPDRISQQQAGPLGRVILAFANTPMQYTRLIKKAASDLRNGRGDPKTNISKILYYGVAQNLIFNALQQALFAIAFGDEEEEEKQDERAFNIINSMSDQFLRGAGVGGAIVSTLKNTVIKLIKQSEKNNPKYASTLIEELAQISPPVGSKIRKLSSAGRSFEWNKKEMMQKGWSLDNPAYMAGANIISAATNVPLDRVIKKIDNITNANNAELETWQRVASAGGWSKWQLGIQKKKKKSRALKRVRKKSKKLIL